MATLLIGRFQNCSHSISNALKQIRTPKSCFYHAYYESYGEIRKFGNPVIRYLATLLSGGFEIAPIRFPMLENILVDTKIMFLSQLSDKLWRKTEKMIIFGCFFEIFFLFWQKFQKLKKLFSIDLEWSTLAKGKVAISKTVATAASRYKQT